MPLLMLANPGAAQADSTGPQALTLTGPNVIHYGTSDYSLASDQRLLRQGTATATGCEFLVQDRVRPGQDLAEVDVAYDPDTCRLVVARGVPSADFADPGPSDLSSSESSTQSAAADASAPAFSAQALSRRQAYAWSWYDEPARWAFGCDVEDGPAQGCLLPPVNCLKNTLSWTPDGTCTVAPGTVADLTSEIAWLRQTGWTVASNFWDRNGPTVPCNETLRSRNQSHFENGFFCQALVNMLPIPDILKPRVAPTNTYYDPSGLQAFADGSALVTTVLRKDGGCQSFLRESRRFGAGLG
jgi:hypothetical protein